MTAVRQLCDKGRPFALIFAQGPKKSHQRVEI
jgi:hypothetical protein